MDQNKERTETWVISIQEEPGGRKSLVIDDGVEPEKMKTVSAGHIFNPQEICTELAMAFNCNIPDRIEFDGSGEFANDQVKSFLQELGIETPGHEKEGLVIVPERRIRPVIMSPAFGY